MKVATNMAVVDLSPHGFVFKELLFQSLILNEFVCFACLCVYIVTRYFAHARNRFARLEFMGD